MNSVLLSDYFWLFRQAYGIERTTPMSMKIALVAQTNKSNPPNYCAPVLPALNAVNTLLYGTKYYIFTPSILQPQQ